AALSAAVCRAITSHSAASNATSQNAIQWRPLNVTRGRLFEDAKLRRSCPGIDGDFARLRQDRFLGEHAAQRPAPARADRLLGGTDAIASPVAKRVLHNAVFAGVIGDDADPPPGQERIA